MLIKKSVLTTTVAIATLGMSAAASAYYGSSNDFFSGNDAGFVVGVQGGYADEHWDNIASPFLVPSSDVNDTGFAARGFVGYDINRMLGFEAGYTYLPKTTISGVNGDITNYAIDLLGKLSVHFTDVFSIYAKAGGSYLHASGGFNNGMESTGDSSRSHIGPAFGVGAAYEVVPNLAIDLSWMRFSGQGHFANSNLTSSDYQPSPDVVLLGISYKFPTRFS